MNPFHPFNPFGDVIDPQTGAPVRVTHQPRAIGRVVAPPSGDFLTLSGPFCGPANAPSAPFTITPSVPYTGTVTLSDEDSGGTFSDDTLTWEDEQTPRTFTYSAPSVGRFLIDITANPAITTTDSVYIVGTTDASETYSTSFENFTSDDAERTAALFDGETPFVDRKTCFQNWCLQNRYASNTEVRAMKAMLAIP